MKDAPFWPSGPPDPDPSQRSFAAHGIFPLGRDPIDESETP
jgi:hypothetical protein